MLFDVDAVVIPGLRPGESLTDLRQRAAGCRACPLYLDNTQTVFGSGHAGARIVLIGEAPGEHEDRQGEPFVGPAGRLLNQALERAGLARAALYLTNVVKHRPWLAQGNRRKNRPPRAGEVKACRPWLQAELALLQPSIAFCLGAPAAREILGKEFKLTAQRGQWLSTPAIPHVLATLHPAYVLIQPPETIDALRATLFADVALVAERARELGVVP